jgi:hypothetical protein
MRSARAVLVALAVLLGPQAARAQFSDMAKVIQVLEKDPPGEYVAVMKRLVACAEKGDVDGMIALTSPVTIEQFGREKLRAFYEKDTMIVLRLFPSMSEGGNQRHVDDGDAGSGWIFEKWFSSKDGKKVPLRFTVLRERGEVRVSYIGLWQEALDAADAREKRRAGGAEKTEAEPAAAKD